MKATATNATGATRHGVPSNPFRYSTHIARHDGEKTHCGIKLLKELPQGTRVGIYFMRSTGQNEYKTGAGDTNPQCEICEETEAEG